jgi:hypothetical protein
VGVWPQNLETRTLFLDSDGKIKVRKMNEKEKRSFWVRKN